MNPKSEVESPPAPSRPASPPNGKGGARPNGEYVDWLTRELGRRPTWEERTERMLAAAARLGYSRKTPRPPPPRRTPEEHAAMVAETDRIREAIRKELKGWSFKSVRFFRDLRDGKLKDEPNAYWRKPDHAGD